MAAFPPSQEDEATRGNIFIERSKRSPWPKNDGWIPTSRLPQLLAEAGIYHAVKALESWKSEEWEDLLMVAIHAGCAVELIAKCHLAWVEPSLIADKGDVSTLLRLAGKDDLVKGRSISAKSITGVEALRRLQIVVPAFPYFGVGEIVLEARNASAHLALVDKDLVADAVSSMVRIVSAVAKMHDVAGAELWGAALSSVAESILDDEASQVQRKIAAKMAAARERLANIGRGLPDDVRIPLYASLSGRLPRTAIDENIKFACPACGYQGWLICMVWDDAWLDSDESLSDDDELERIAFPEVYECTLCDLELNEREIEALDVFPRSIKFQADGSVYED